MVRSFGVNSALTAFDVEDGASQLRHKPIQWVITNYGWYRPTVSTSSAGCVTARAANYPLMSSVAESLHNFCRGEPAQGVGQFEVVQSHITAMAALISDKSTAMTVPLARPYSISYAPQPAGRTSIRDR